MKIVPILLSTTLEEFRTQLAKVSPLTHRLNIDIADGVAAPNKTISLEEALAEIGRLSDVEKYKFDFDLMVKDWGSLIEELTHVPENINVNSAVVHQKFFGRTPSADFEIGLAVDLDDSLDFKLINQVSLVQIMTINLGFQGTPFAPEALAKITELRQSGFEGQIVIDGGVNPETLSLVMENKGLPDIIGVGGYLTRAADPLGNYKKLLGVLTDYVE
jgi:pentose-5-phosphate-3-epimerase